MIDSHIEVDAPEADGVAQSNWTNAFAVGSDEAFAAGLAENVRLEATLLEGVLEGRAPIARLMATMSGIYESLDFTHQARVGLRTYVEWRATALHGTELFGVTVLVADAQGRIEQIAIHHRPLHAGLRLAAHAQERLGVINLGPLPGSGLAAALMRGSRPATSSSAG